MADNTSVYTFQFHLVLLWFCINPLRWLATPRQLPSPVRSVSASTVFLAALERFKVSDFAANSFVSSAAVGPAAPHELTRTQTAVGDAATEEVVLPTKLPHGYGMFGSCGY